MPGGRNRRGSGCCCCGNNRLVALAGLLGASCLLYYLHHYRGMHIHLQLLGPGPPAAGRVVDEPPPLAPAVVVKRIGVPRFVNLLENKHQYHPVEIMPEQQNPAPPVAAAGTAAAAGPTTTRRHRTARGTPEYLRSVNATRLVYAPSPPECVNSRLVFAVATSLEPSAARQRQAVRDTWASGLAALPDAWRGCAVFYALATATVGDEPGGEAALLAESQHRKDIIVLEMLPEANKEGAWSARELRVILASQALFHLAAEYPAAAYFVRTNHRAFWNLGRLTESLHHWSDTGGSSNATAGGRRRLAGKVLRSDWVHRDPADQLYTSRRQYPDQMYPESLLDDPGYVVTGEALRLMARLAEDTPLVYNRDVYITGILRTRAGAELDLLADVKASRAVPVSPCHYRLFVATPTVDADEMRRVWPKFVDPRHKCSYTVLNEDDIV